MIYNYALEYLDDRHRVCGLHFDSSLSPQDMKETVSVITADKGEFTVTDLRGDVYRIPSSLLVAVRAV